MNDKIKELARQEAFKYFFCNVGEDDWPDDPDAFMDKVEEGAEYEEVEALDLSYEDENGKCMNIWEPFEQYLISSVREMMDDYTYNLISFYEEAKKLEGRQGGVS